MCVCVVEGSIVCVIVEQQLYPSHMQFLLFWHQCACQTVCREDVRSEYSFEDGCTGRACGFPIFVLML